jgi:hypothetical protein
MVECSRERRSNIRTEPSAPTEAKTSRDCGDQATSYTSRSWAMSWVTGMPVEMSQTVQVCERVGEGSAIGAGGLRASETLTVSIEEVTICVGSSVDQEKEVSGAEWSALDCGRARRATGGSADVRFIVKTSELNSTHICQHGPLHQPTTRCTSSSTHKAPLPQLAHRRLVAYQIPQPQALAATGYHFPRSLSRSSNATTLQRATQPCRRERER